MFTPYTLGETYKNNNVSRIDRTPKIKCNVHRCSRTLFFYKNKIAPTKFR